MTSPCSDFLKVYATYVINARYVRQNKLHAITWPMAVITYHISGDCAHCMAQGINGDSWPTLRQASAMPPREGGARGATRPNGCTDPWGHAANGPAPAPNGRGLGSHHSLGRQWQAWSDGSPHRGAAVHNAFHRLFHRLHYVSKLASSVIQQ